MKFTTRFITLLLSTLVCILAVNSFSSVQSTNAQYLDEQVNTISQAANDSQNRILMSSRSSQSKLDTSEGFELSTRVNLLMTRRFKWLEELIEALKKVSREGDTISKFIAAIGILILRLLNAILNPVSGLIFAVWIYFRKAFEPKWEEVRVQVPVQRTFRQESENSENVSPNSPPKSPEKKRSASFGLEKFWKKSEAAKNKNEEIDNNTARNFDNESKQYKSKIDTRIYEGSIIRIPKRIYEEDYCLVDLDLLYKIEKKKSGKLPSNLSSQDSEKAQTLWEIEQVKIAGENIYSLELELSSPKFEANPAKKQSQALNSDKLHYTWNCRVSGLGKHRLEFLVRIVDPSSPANPRQIGKKGWDVQVVGIPGLTGKQFRVLLSVLPILSLSWAVFISVLPKNSTPASTPPTSSPISPPIATPTPSPLFRRRTYPFFTPTLPGYTRVESGKDEVQWKPGSTHPDHEHIVAAETELYWIPEPGYSWTSGKTKSERRYDENNLDVQWKPGSTHPNHNHIVAAETEGFWKPELGYRWYCSDGSDRHRDGDRDGDSSLKVSEDSSPTKDTVTLKEAFTRQKDTVRLSCSFLELELPP
jgi:hypothetical protein